MSCLPFHPWGTAFTHQPTTSAPSLAPCRRRIFQYYLPIFFWCERQLQQHRAHGSTAPLVLGISAPQGCGKTTLCEQLQALFECTGAPAASISIDDFYHTYEAQQAGG